MSASACGGVAASYAAPGHCVLPLELDALVLELDALVLVLELDALVLELEVLLIELDELDELDALVLEPEVLLLALDVPLELAAWLELEVAELEVAVTLVVTELVEAISPPAPEASLLVVVVLLTVPPAPAAVDPAAFPQPASEARRTVVSG